MKGTFIIWLYLLATILALASAIIYPSGGMRWLFIGLTILYAWMTYNYYVKYKQSKEQK